MKLRPKNRVSAFVMTLLAAVFALGVGRFAFGAMGDTPAHTKNLTDNHDGTYTISLDVVGDSERKPNNINVVVIFDTSGSMNSTRMNAAKTAVNNLANSLFAYNQSNPDTVEMALVDFSTHAQTVSGTPTNSASTFRTAVNGLSAGGGTNWEAALAAANSVNFGDNDQTFVVFVSDGNPTFRDTQGTTRITDNRWYNYDNIFYDEDGVYGLGSDNPQNYNYSPQSMQYCYNHAVDDAQTLATKVGVNNFFTIGAFGNVDRMQSLTTAAGAPATNYYSASDTAALNQAIADILAKIEMAGIANAEIVDGTTNQVTTSSGNVAELLEVDTSSFKYYRSGGSYGNMQPWADAPAATFANGKVDWDLESVGVLENGVRYTVTFDCYPSQYTYDTIAKLKNGDITYNSLDANVKKYIKENVDGSYTLLTNTNASLSWDDTRDDEGQQTDAYVNPDPVATAADSLPIEKKWEGADPDVESIPITVMVGEEVFHTANLTATNSWKTSSYISVGIIKNGKALPGAEGHDFSFAELGDEQYHWELDAPTVHPMRIGEDIVMLVKVDADHPAPSGADTYTIGDATYYADSAAGGLTATNHRRSNLNLTKAVTGEDAPANATFPFTLTVNNSKAPATEPTDDPDHNSDYYVWFSIYDTKAGATVRNATVSGATGPNAEGYYYAPSGSAISVQMKDGWNLRFTNLPSGTTYTFAEGDLADGFAFNKAELTSGEDSTFKGAKTTTGTIENTKSSYYVTYTNDYALTDLEITKKWEDNSNQDGIRPTAEEFASMLTLEPAVDGKTPTVVVDSEDSNKYIISYTGLPRFNNGEEVDYTVTEEVPEGYQPTETSAKDHGTITNPHTPEVTKVTVVKAWNDQDDIGKIRPASINAQLTADGTASGDPVALNADNEWTYTWENLPKYKDGKAIEYSADETAVPAGYEKTGPVKTETDTGVTFTVTNTYNPKPVSVDPPVQKVITGNDDLYNKGDFTFTIEAVSPTDAPMPANTSITNSADYEFEGKTGFYEFGEITFTKPGTYEYLVKESGSVAGVTNDPDAASGKTLTFTVTDDGTGKLVVNPTTDQVQLSFTNVYNADGEASIVVSKEITGAAWPAGKTLTLTIAGADGAPMPETTTATLDAAGSVTFGPIKYGLADKDKTYTYTITESSFGDGWTGSPASITATVAVTDNGDGTLKADVTYDPTDAKFTNTYKATGNATLEVEKKLEGAAWPEGKTLTMTLAGQDGAPMPAEGGESVELTAADKATFGKIAYTEADAGKTYTYKISEGNGFGAGWTGSGDVTATVVVTDNGNGTLATKVTYTPEDATITNTYKATGEIELFAGKKLDAAESLNAPDVTGKYTLTLEAQDGAPMPEGATDGKVEIKNADGDGTMTTFGKIAFTEADAGKTYTYKVTETGTVAGVENGTAEYTVTVKVTDNGNGTLKAEVAEGSQNTLFTNTYKVEPVEASFPVKKVISVPEGLKGPAEWSYTIDVAAGEGAPKAETMTGTVDQDNDTANFGPFVFTAPGEYTYTVTETGTVAGINNDADATTGKTVTITVVDNGNGTMTATADSTENNPVTFTNTYSVEPTTAQFPVKKIMSVPDGADGPSDWSYTIDVAANDGAPKAEAMTGTVDQDNDTVTFGDFTYTEPGTYTYTVSETGEVDGVTNDAEADGKTVTVTVVDNGDGTLTATADSTANKPLTFTNTYNVEPTTASFPVKKVLSVPQGLEGPAEWSYDITVAANEGAPVVETMTGTVNQDNDTATFGEFTFTKPGTYTYTVTESGKIDGVTNDLVSTKPVVITVVDNGDGTLTATADSTTDEPLTFTNTYSVEPTTAKFPVKKIMSVPEGADGPSEWSYTIDVAAGEGAPDAKTMTGTVDQDNDTVTFGDFTYTEPGTYTYTVTETGTVAGVTNDTAAETGKTVTVTVVDNGDGTLTATADSTTDKPVSFTNTYAAEGTAVPVAKKVAEGFELEDGQFSFELKDAEGNVLQTAMNDADGNVTFEPIPYTAAGEYTYTINEVVTEGDDIADDTHVCDVTVTVTDKGDGTLEATIDYSNNTFTNTHEDNEKEVSYGETQTNVDGHLVQAGEVLTYTITYANNTGKTATVTVEDTIPQYTTYNNDASPEATFADGKLTWTIEDVPAGGTGEVTFSVTVDKDAKDAQIVNDADVRDGENESTTNAVTTSIPVKEVTDEGGTDIDGQGVQVGDILTYNVSFTIGETGDPVTAATVKDAVPAGTEYYPGSATGDWATSIDDSGDTIVWTFAGDEENTLAPGTYTATFKVKVTEDALALESKRIDNTAIINVNDDPEVKTNTVTNTPETGSLTISKTVTVPEGYTIDTTKAFKFTFTLKDQNGDPLEREYAYTGDYEGTIKSGGTVTLKHGESITIQGLPAGAKYEISEAAVAGYTPESANLTGEISADAPATAAFVNAYNTKPAKLPLRASKTLAVEPPAYNAPDVSGKYTFTIAAASEGAPLPATTEVTNPDGDGTAVSFGDISFTKPDEYQYTITESGEVAGVTNGQTSYTVKVKVTDNSDGTLSAKVVEGMQTTAFTNTYKVTPVTIDKGFEVTKDLTGTPLKAGAFEFVLTGGEGAPMPGKTEATNDDQGKVTFDTITYTEPGTYTYTITEKNGGKGGYHYDEHTVTVTVKVTDNGEGALVAEVAYSDDVVFDNTYEASGDVDLSAAKKLTGRALEEGQFTFQLLDQGGNVIETVTNNGSGAVQFKTISYDQTIFDDQATSGDASGADDSAATDSAADEGTVDEGAAAGAVDEAAATDEADTGEAAVDDAADEAATDDEAAAEASDEAATDEPAAEETSEVAAEPATDEPAAAAEDNDAPRTKTFTYTIREVDDGKPGYSYDDHTITVSVEVTDNDDGTLTAVPTYEGETTFTNAYEAEGEAQFNGTKTTTGKELVEGQFAFQLKDAQGNVIEEVTNDAEGKFAFSPIAYYQNAEQTDADTGTFTYTIVEVNDGQTGWTYDAHESTVTVTVTDNGDGTLATEVVYGDGDEAAFNNPYKPLATSAPIRAKKALEGRSLKAGEFTFELSDAEGKVVKTAKNAADGSIDFGNIAFDEVGTYTFTAVEVEGSDSHITYDTSVKTFTVEVVDVDGQLEATVTCDDETATFENVYTPDQPKKGKKKVPPVVKKLLLPTTGDPMAAGSVMTLSAIGAAALLTGLNRRRKRK